MHFTLKGERICGASVMFHVERQKDEKQTKLSLKEINVGRFTPQISKRKRK